MRSRSRFMQSVLGRPSRASSVEVIVRPRHRHLGLKSKRLLFTTAMMSLVACSEAPFSPAGLEIVLAEGTDRLLPALDPELSARAKSDLEKLGVRVRLETYVTEIDERGVLLQSGERIPAANVIWAAGVCGRRYGAHDHGR